MPKITEAVVILILSASVLFLAYELHWMRVYVNKIWRILDMMNGYKDKKVVEKHRPRFKK